MLSFWHSDPAQEKWMGKCFYIFKLVSKTILSLNSHPIQYLHLANIAQKLIKMLLWLEIYVTWMHFENLNTNFIFKLAPANSIIINIFCQYFVPAKKLFKYNYFHNKICENALEFDILHRINTPVNKLFGCPPVHSCCNNWLRKCRSSSNSY